MPDIIPPGLLHLALAACLIPATLALAWLGVLFVIAPQGEEDDERGFRLTERKSK